MPGILKDDLTVALDDVDRLTSRTVTVCEDLAGLAADPDISTWLRARAATLGEALDAFNAARRNRQQIPEVDDPERSHLQALWLGLKAAVTGAASRAELQEHLTPLEEQLGIAIGEARRLNRDEDIDLALAALQAASSSRVNPQESSGAPPER
jgi:hypothetical protein